MTEAKQRRIEVLAALSKAEDAMRRACAALDKLHAQRAAFAEDQWACRLPHAHIAVAAIQSELADRIAAAETSYGQSVVLVYRLRTQQQRNSMDDQ